MILYYAVPHRAYHSCPATVLAKLYSNSMLALFNSRLRIVGARDWASDDNVISLDAGYSHSHYSGAHSAGPGVGRGAESVGPIVFKSVTRTATSSFGGGIHVEQEVWTEGDGQVRSRILHAGNVR